MLGLLPQLLAGDMMGSIVAFRIVYYALPASGAVVALLRPFSTGFAAVIAPSSARRSPAQADVQIIARSGGRFMATAQWQSCHLANNTSPDGTV